MAGKGDDRRPQAISNEEMEDRWARTFAATDRLRIEEDEATDRLRQPARSAANAQHPSCP
jgi:hypothetical protein